MTNIVTHNYQGFAITQKESGNYVSLTDMAKACGKKVNDYLRNDSTNEYLDALSFDTGIPVSSLVKVSRGGRFYQGTWAHPEVAIDFASWCNVQFRIWANRTLTRIALKDDVIHTPVEFDLKAKKQALNAVLSEVMDLQILVAESKVSKLKARLQEKAKPKPPETPDEMMEAIAAFCKGKSRISSTEILHHIEPQKIKRTQLRHNAVVKYLRPLGYAKNGQRHKALINGAKLQVYSWVN